MVKLCLEKDCTCYSLYLILSCCLGLLTHLCSFMFAGGVPTEILIEVSATLCIYSICNLHV